MKRKNMEMSDRQQEQFGFCLSLLPDDDQVSQFYEELEEQEYYPEEWRMSSDEIHVIVLGDALRKRRANAATPSARKT